MPISFPNGMQTTAVHLQTVSQVPNQGMMIVSGREVPVREFVHDFDDCMGCVKSIPYAIVNFFAHRLADTIMFFRAFSSMGGATRPADIETRIHRLEALRNHAANPWTNNRNVFNIVNTLNPELRSLLYYTEPSYVAQITHTRDPEVCREVRQEIVRECNMAIHFQQTLTIVNSFYMAFTGAEENIPATTVGGPTTIGGGYTIPVTVPRPRGATTIPVTIGGANLNIPGTVPYVQNNIPAAVQLKSNQIAALKVQYDALGAAAPAMPAYMNCPLSLEIMSIPVFDASHTGVQNALRAASAPGGTTAALSSYDLRHHVDKDQMERYIASMNFPRCPTCRHPATGRIELGNLLIDTHLQDEILDFLRRSVNPATTAATTV